MPSAKEAETGRSQLLDRLGVKTELERVKEAINREHPDLNPIIFESGKGLIALAWSKRHFDWVFKDMGPYNSGISHEYRSRVHGVLIRAYAAGDLVDSHFQRWGERHGDHISVNILNAIEDKLDLDTVQRRSWRFREGGEIWFSDMGRREDLSELIAHSILESLDWHPPQHPPHISEMEEYENTHYPRFGKPVRFEEDLFQGF